MGNQKNDLALEVLSSMFVSGEYAKKVPEWLWHATIENPVDQLILDMDGLGDGPGEVLDVKCVRTVLIAMIDARLKEIFERASDDNDLVEAYCRQLVRL